MRPTLIVLAVLLFVSDHIRPVHAQVDAATAQDKAQGKPKRIVSLDYCADQYVLQFTPAENILALSPEAVQEFSYFRARAEEFPSVRPMIEDVISIKPDMVVRSYGGGYGIVEVLDQLNVPVVQIGYANTLAEVKESVLSVSSALGAAQMGRKIVFAMDERLQQIAAEVRGAKSSALYMTPTGVTAGPGTLMHDVLLAAGFDNFENKPGWRALPLERLVYATPDVVARAFYQAAYGHRDLWSAAAHPVTERQLSKARHVPLQGAWTSCGAWFLMDAVMALRDDLATRVLDNAEEGMRQ